MKSISVDNRGRKNEHIAYLALKTAFIVAPIVAGLDKFFYVLTDWSKYLAPIFPETLNIKPATFMLGVGVIEIIAGIGVILKPKIFAHIVGAWLIGIIVNLLVLGEHYDIVLRDIGLAIGAFALGQLAMRFETSHSHDAKRKISGRQSDQHFKKEADTQGRTRDQFAQ